MNPVQTHLKSEGIDITVDDAVDVRLQQYCPGRGLFQVLEREFYRDVIEFVLEGAKVTPETKVNG